MSVRLPSPSPARVSVGMLLACMLAMLILLGAWGAVPAHAVEDDIPDPAEQEEPPPPDIEELCREGTIAAEFCPERYEQPSWFQWLIYPLLIIGLVMIAVTLIAYLAWQPRFAREREERKSRR